VFQRVIGHNIHHTIKIFHDASEIDASGTNGKLFGEHNGENFTSDTFTLH
jgi:hypothetical protein